MKLGLLIKYYVRKIFTVNSAENVHQELFSDLYLILLNSGKYSQSIQETLL